MKIILIIFVTLFAFCSCNKQTVSPAPFAGYTFRQDGLYLSGLFGKGKRERIFSFTININQIKKTK